ncbi:MAG: ABC transporter permease [Oscillospiraceae bacterium]|jgi:ribose transport system permease protein|nr:ABC transporter permease [Oscillospiraceae bacterium]
MEKKKQSQTVSFLKRLVRQNGFALAVIVIILGFVIYFFISKMFLASGNLKGGIFVPMVVPGVMIVAAVPLLIGGSIDLSTAQQAAFASVVFAKLLIGFPNIPWPIMVVVTLLCGVIFGLINIFLTNVLNFMPFIATIGMSSVYLGVASAWTVMNNVGINNDGFSSLASIAYFDKTVPLLFIFMVVLILVYAYILSNTRFGRSVYMIGGNQTAARLAGLNPKKIRAALFINSGVISALAGLVWAAQMKMGHPKNIVDNQTYFTSLTAVILGGAAFHGGSGGVAAGAIALLMVTVFDNGLTMLAQVTAVNGQPLYGAHVNTVLKGLILIAALMLDYVKSSRAQRALISAAMKGQQKKGAAATVES